MKNLVCFEKAHFRRFSSEGLLKAPAFALVGLVALESGCSDEGSSSDEERVASSSGGDRSSSGGDGGASGGNSGGAFTGEGANGSGGEASTGGRPVLEPSAGGQSDYPDIEFLYDPDKDEMPTTCAERTLAVERLPLDVYVVLDRTASMQEDCTLNLGGPPEVPSKWCRASSALAHYFTHAAATGHRGALQFMIPAETKSTVCDAESGNLHSEPEVGLTLLPDTDSGPLVSALQEASPGATSTAIESALNGIAMFTGGARTVGRQMIGILITDGDPTFCNENVEVLSGIPRRHLEETGISTFIIGMTGADPTSLETLAMDGGSPSHADFCDPNDPNPSCHYWSVGDGDPEAFVAALESIEKFAAGCEFALPQSDQGLIDLDTVRVEMSAEGAAGQLLQLVTEPEDCRAGAYYTDQLDEVPTIRLCPASCESMPVGGRIDVTVQCEGN